MLNYLKSLSFASPWILTLLVIPALMILWYILRYNKIYPTLKLPILEGILPFQQNVRGLFKQNLFILRALALATLIVALARPQRNYKNEEVNTEGIDIVIAMDVSGSMLARDFEPDRLGAAKERAADFISQRPNDRIGLVVFAGESFTQCPLTIDHNVVGQLLDEIKNGLIEDGTAIGMGLANAVNRLRESDAKSRVVILLTDGVNNSGFIDPLTAVEAANQYGIRVYTIGVGRRGKAPYPVQTHFGLSYQNIDVEIDEELLEEIAEQTGGQYFRATNNQGLKDIYETIDELEKSKIQVTVLSRKTEEFYGFLLLGLGILGIEWLLRYTWLRSIP
ncbi:MAG: VWA domain-containing protein [Bacteroidota bacterium]